MKLKNLDTAISRVLAVSAILGGLLAVNVWTWGVVVRQVAGWFR